MQWFIGYRSHPYALREGTIQDTNNRRWGSLGAILETDCIHVDGDSGVLEGHKGTSEKSSPNSPTPSFACKQSELWGTCKVHTSVEFPRKNHSLSFQYRAANCWLLQVFCLNNPTFSLTFSPKKAAACDWQKWIVKWWISHAISPCFGVGEIAVFFLLFLFFLVLWPVSMATTFSMFPTICCCP